MEDESGTVVGWDVPDALRYEVEGREDLIWMNDSFVVNPYVATSPVSIVLNPAPVGIIGAAEGVKDPIILYPAMSVDRMIHEIHSLDHIGEYASGILSFNLLEEVPESGISPPSG